MPPPRADVILAAPAVQKTHVMKKMIECDATLVRTLPVEAECMKRVMKAREKKTVQEEVKRRKVVRSRVARFGKLWCAL